MDKQRILIVEDDLDLAEMLDAYFRVQNYDVITAAWGEDAVRICSEETVDLIVLDIRLPDINGYEVCRQLRTQRRTEGVPIIFLTEKRERVDRLQGLELGVVDYITKPFDIQELRLRVRNAITRAERQSAVNPITDLPEGPQMDEKLTALLPGDLPWAVLMVSVGGLERLRDLYGFVAADEVLRAVTLMVKNAVREFGGDEDFIGHLASNTLGIITRADKAAKLREKIEGRIRPSLQHFYPQIEGQSEDGNLLHLTTRMTDHSAGLLELDAVKAKLLNGEGEPSP